MKVQILIFAKSPAPGLVKTRLSPPLTAGQAAEVAEAALVSTLEAVTRCPASVRFLVLHGGSGAWLPRGIEVVAQRGIGFNERLANAFEDAGAPALLIGMDTPHVTPELLSHSAELLMHWDVDAVLGPAADGGWWTIGLRRPDPRVFAGIPMSTDRTGADQLQRLECLGLRTALLPCLADVDRIEDAHEAAAAIPHSAFAAAVARLC